MKVVFLLIVLQLSFCAYLFGQTPVDVAESTLKVGGLSEEIFYYGFSEGDQMIFNFEEVNGKELKELELIEMPSSSKFMDYKTKKIDNKKINITKTAIYKFRFSNSSISGRVCKFKIQRIPSSEATINFNTSVYWKTVFDTSFTIEQEKYLVRSDTTISNITDQIAKVHSQGNMSGNKTTFNFTLPMNTVVWSYYVGVDQAGEQVYETAATELATKASPLIESLPGYGPLAALALESASYLSVLQKGEDIDYYIVDGSNVNYFLGGQQFYYIKKGKVINDYAKMLTPLKGTYHFCLSNDNAITGVTVSVKIIAIQVNQIWDTKPIQRLHVATRQEAYLKN